MSSKRGKSNKFKAKLEEYFRILKLARKPSKEEYLQIAKISAIGILLIGSIGFFIYLGMGVLPQAVANMGTAQISANFTDELNTTHSSQELTLQINNIDKESSTGKIHIELSPILCSVNKTSFNLSEISPDSSKNVKIKVTNIQENSDVQAIIWGENLAKYDSRTNSLMIYATEPSE